MTLVHVISFLVEGLQSRRGWLSCFLMWLLVYVLSGLVEGLLGKKGQAASLSDAAPSVQSPRGLSSFLMWLLVYVFSGLVEGLKSQRGWGCLQFVIVVFPDHTHLLFLLSDVAPSVCPFWSSGRLAGEERAGCIAF